MVSLIHVHPEKTHSVSMLPNPHGAEYKVAHGSSLNVCNLCKN